jgi:tripartite-type tricarboxylate transporter receptor subunit TctC
MKRPTAWLVTALSLAGFGAAMPAQAEWPADRPIQVIVPGPPGGGMDVFVRPLMRLLQSHLPGANFVIVNKAGAGGQLAFEAVALAAPDGYTIGAAQTPALNTLPIERSVRYSVPELTYLGNVVDDPGGLFVRADSPLRSLDDLLARARREPGMMPLASAGGIGSDDHLLILKLQAATGTRFSHVPYSGTPPAITALLAGDLPVASLNMSEGLPMLRDGTLRALAQGGETRWSGTPDVPTFSEQGVKMTGGSTRGIVAPGRLPAAQVQRLSTALAATLADPAWQADAERLSVPLRVMSATDQRDHFLAEDATLRELWKTNPWRD